MPKAFNSCMDLKSLPEQEKTFNISNALKIFRNVNNTVIPKLGETRRKYPIKCI